MIKQVLLNAFVILFMVFLLLYLFQRQLIYFPERKAPSLATFNASDMKAVTVLTEDKIALNSWYKAASGKQATILYFHGNAGHIGYRMPLIRQFIHSGFGVLLLEYRSYGGNSGAPSEKGLYRDGEAALRFLRDQGVKAKKTVVYGESLGSGVATKLASEHPLCAIVLQSPFTSLADVAHFHYPWIFIQPWDQYNSLERIKLIQVPLLVLHGKEDQLVPYAQGLRLYHAANEPKKMLSFEKRGHNNLWGASGFSEHIIAFINEYCK